jgi:predicted RNase H-like nuclease (RuvC/YqgF family)
MDTEALQAENNELKQVIANQEKIINYLRKQLESYKKQARRKYEQEHDYIPYYEEE